MSNLSDDPSDTELGQIRYFDTPFIPTSATPIEGENAALATALKQTVSDQADEAMQHLEDFVGAYPASRWVLSVELNRGLALYPKGYFSRSVEAFGKAWEAGKNEKSDPKAGLMCPKALADRALAEWMRMECRVGRREEAEKLYSLMNGREPEDTAGRYYGDARDALWMMKNKPGESFLCGPYALGRILAFQNSPKAGDAVLTSYRSTEHGVSLDKVWQLSEKLGMHLQLAKRKPGAEVLVPSVVNWKLGHYAALVERKEDMVHSEDPTFGNETWLSEKALDEEASGYFLVAEGPLPQGWEAVTVGEASKVWGTGIVYAQPKEGPQGGGGAGGGGGPGSPSPCGGCCLTGGGGGGGGPNGGGPSGPSGGPSGGGGPSFGMPRAQIDLELVASMMVDTPLKYKPPVGQEMDFTLTYHQKTALALPFSNFGPNWSFNWEGCIQYNISGGGSNYVMYSPNGGQEAFTPVSSLGAPASSPTTTLAGFTQFTKTQVAYTNTFGSNSGSVSGLPSYFVRQFGDGSQEVYGRAVVGYSQVTLLLTEAIDPFGNVVVINYDNLNRITSIADALGKTSTFSYVPGSTDPLGPSYLVSQITDPYGRSAIFSYTNGELSSITDMLGMTSSFTYQSNISSEIPSTAPLAYAGDWVTSMTTPYGTTNFSYAGSDTASFEADDREVDILEPDGSRRHARYNLSQLVPETYTNTPTGLTVSNPDYGLEGGSMNTLYWDKAAMADAPLAPSSATEYHWLTDNSQQSFFLGSIKRPLESRVYYQYSGLSNPNLCQMDTGSGDTFSSASGMGRILVNASGNQTSQVTTYSYNSYGKMTGMTDPKGRVYNYTYASNGIDLLTLTNTTSGTVTLAGYGNYTNHLPGFYVDSAGQTWAYNYNGFGEKTSVTTPALETTTYNYDSNGFLTSIVPPQPGGTVTYTPDALERVYRKNDAVNGTLTYSYDNGDRVSSISYPDGSSETYNYTKLDLTSYMDRQSRTTNYSYDSTEHLVSVTDPKTQTTVYNWCLCGGLTSIQDPAGNLTSFTRDVEGRVVTKSYSDGSAYHYQYEPTGTRIAQVTDPKGQVTQNGYDVDDALLTVNYSNAAVSTAGVTFTYDTVLPRVTSMADGTGTTSYSYYAIGSTGGGQVYTVYSPVGSSGSASVTFTYDPDSRVTGRNINGTSETYNYTNAELTGVTNPLGSFTYNYDSSSARLASVAYPNSQSVSYGYYTPSAGSGRLETITNLASGGATLSYFNYAYDHAGEITQWTKQLGVSMSSTATNVYGYDPDSELQAVTQTFASGATSQTSSFNYDSAGNRTQEKLVVGATGSPQAGSFTHTFGTNNLNQLTNETPNPLAVKGSTGGSATLTVNATPVAEDANNNFNTTISPVGGTSTPLTIQATGANGASSTQKNHVLNTEPFVYDANGNELTDQVYRYSYDAANRLISISSINPTPPTMPDNITFTYDGKGHRVGITEIHGTAVLTAKTFVWCNDILCQERDVTGHTVTKQFFGQGEQISGTNYYYTFDHLGSVRELTDSSGNVQASYDYDSYGRQTVLSQAVTADFGYTGFYMNHSSGLDLTWFRAYDPNKGRWLNRDPLDDLSSNPMAQIILGGPSTSMGLPRSIHFMGQGQDTNLYEMVKNNPLMLTDPLGLQGQLPTWWHPPMKWPNPYPLPPGPPYYAPPSQYGGYWANSCMWVQSVGKDYLVWDFCHCDYNGHPGETGMPVPGSSY